MNDKAASAKQGPRFRKSFHEELERLQHDLLRMGTAVEEAISNAVRSLKEKNLDLAQRVVDEDRIVDDMQIDIEQRCLGLLALQQPMARDLRAIGTALKIVTDLERMADHAQDIAKVALRLQGQTYIKPLIDVPRMAEIAQKMVRQALDAYVNKDAAAAYEMTKYDDEVDSLYGQVFRELLTYMMEDPSTIRQATHFLFVASHLERVADHATNLGEWVIYMITGERKELND